MKKLTITIALGFLFVVSAFSQENLIKNYSLKNYIAPEIKYQLMNLGTGLYLNGFTGTSNNNENSFSTNFNLAYYQYRNTSLFQGISDARLYTSYFHQGTKENEIRESYNSLVLNLNYYGQNRFYNQNKAFLGLHGYLEYRMGPSNSKSDEENYKNRSNNFSITPYLSGGKGRIQPVQSAREAMDILLALQKCNRLSLIPDHTLIDSLAKVANRIRYKRFYDTRYKTIYQLEELDRALRNMHLVDTADMIYFANLNDIWNFTQNFKRGSGIRYEGGIVPKYALFYFKSEETNQTDQNNLFINDHKWYGLFGFFSFNRMRPINYAWQSDFMVDITFGYDAENWKYESENQQPTTIKYNNLKAMLNVSWQFGYYPNTRTYLGITPYSAVSYKSETDFSNTEVGLNAGFILNAYYYVSPRLRLTFLSNLFYIDSFDNSTPAPFWNNATYSQNDRSALQYTNDIITYPVDAFKGQSKRFIYTFSFSLRYAIF